MERSTSASFQPVEDWLRGLGLLHYAQSFYDNGYEDIETCKLIGVEDLNVIDITSERDRNDILSAVSRLKQNLYFELEPAPNITEVERQKFDAFLLKSKLKECLQKHRVQLIEPPYYNPDGSLGDLYPLAIRFAEELGTFFQDVLEALEQLRKRQLPVQSYEQITQESRTNSDSNRRSNTFTDPAEYLNCESNQPHRGFSFSKYDTRVTKSTTDLTKDLQLASIESSGKGKSMKKVDKNKSKFGGAFFKRNIGTKSMRENRKSTYDFNATDVTMSQNEIVKIFAKVKNKEMSQEDAIAAIKKRGLNTSTSNAINARSDLSPSSSPEAARTLEKPNIQRKGRLSKSMIKRPTPTVPTAQFYTKDVEHHQSLTSLQSPEGSLERSNSRSMSLYDIESSPQSSKSSPELAKSGIFRSIRNSLRKKGRSSDTTPEKSMSPSSSTSSQESITPASEFSAKALLDGRITEFNKPFTEHAKQPPPPPSRPAHISLVSHKPDDANVLPECDSVFEERRPSLKIKSYEKYQDDIFKRRSQKTNSDVNSNLTEKLNTADNIPTATRVKTQKPLPPPRQTKVTDKSSEHIVPKPPPRPYNRSLSSTSASSIETTSIDEIGQDLTKLIAGLDDELIHLEDPPDEKPKKKPLIPPRSIKRSPHTINTNTNTAAEASKSHTLELSLKTAAKGSELVKQDSMVKNNPTKVLKKVSLKQIVKKKLHKENIHLQNMPYTLQDGKWNIPYALIERYGFELEQPVTDIMKIFEEIRTTVRTSNNEPTEPFQMENVHKNSISLEDASLDEWLVLIGLPMFAEDLKDVDIQTVEEVSRLSQETFKNIGVFDEKHVSTLLKKAIAYCASSV